MRTPLRFPIMFPLLLFRIPPFPPRALFFFFRRRVRAHSFSFSLYLGSGSPVSFPTRIPRSDPFRVSRKDPRGTIKIRKKSDASNRLLSIGNEAKSSRADENFGPSNFLPQLANSKWNLNIFDHGSILIALKFRRNRAVEKGEALFYYSPMGSQMVFNKYLHRISIQCWRIVRLYSGEKRDILLPRFIRYNYYKQPELFSTINVI